VRQIEAFCFDVDGTMYSINSMVRRNFFAFVHMRRFFKTLHMVRDSMRQIGQVEDFRQEQAAKLADEIGVSKSQAEQMIRTMIDEKWMEMFPRIHPFPELKETLSSLSDMGFKLAVLSDYPVWPKLSGMGLAGLKFSAVVNAEDVGALKPHSAPFIRVAHMLKVPVEKILHVGDLERTDVVGALGAGMLTARFYEGKRPETKALFAFKHWRRFIPLLRWKGLLR